MADAVYRDWMARAQEHRSAGRALDALVCFRRAARLAPAAGRPHFGIGEAYWQLGRPREALTAWREAIRRKPKFLQALLAEADASMFVGDVAAARSAALRALELSPAEPRSTLIVALTDQPVDAARVHAAIIAAPQLLADAHLSRAVARALRNMHQDHAREQVVAALLPLIGTLEATALAELGSQAPEDAVTALLGRKVVRTEVDGLRRLALSLRVGGVGSGALAETVAERYAAACTELFAPVVPLLWPHRTGGHRLRVMLLGDGEQEAIVRDALASLAAHVPPIELGVLAAVARPEQADANARIATTNASLRAALEASNFTTTVIAQLNPFPESDAARVVTARDADLLLDLSGMTSATGPLLAARPVRSIWSVVGIAAPPPPLVDRILADAGPALADALRALQQEVDAMPARAPAPELAARLDAAVMANQSQEVAAAREGYDALLAEQPGHAPTLYLRGMLSREAGDTKAALADFTAAATAAPRDAKSWAAAAQVEMARHATASARALVEQGLLHAPDDAGLLRTLGHVERDEHNAKASLNAFARAVALHPMDADTHYNYGVALQMLRMRADAARAYQRALALAPDMLEAHYNLGVLFHEQGDTDAAISALEWVIEHQPQRAEAHRMLVDILDLARRHDAWKVAVRRFERTCPDALGLVACALEYYQYLGDFKTVENYLARVAREKFKPANDLDLVDALEQLLFMLLYFDLDPGVMAAFYRSYDQVAQHVYGPPMAHTEPRRPGRLRIGYLSADMRDHVMGRMMVEPLSLHDRERFAIHCYSTSPEAGEDAVTSRYRALADEFVRVDDLTDAAAAERIAADDLDLLVDLSTHTKGARPGILARKPARVQMTHVASAGALGLSAIDFKLTDRFCDLPDNATELVEKLLPMDGCVYPLRRMTAAADHPYHRDRLGIAPDDLVIGALVTPLKLSRRTLALWKEILAQLPRARLAFSPNAPWIRDTYPRLLTAAGIDPERAILLPQGRNEGERLGRYTLADFVLDPMPYGNVNGTIEPLNMGVPVVTLCGSSHGERTGYSILTQFGVTSTIAHSGRDYVAIAVRLATDPGFMRDVRAAIAVRLAEPPLAAMHDYTRNLEAAYLRALEIAREGGDIAWSNSDAITGT